MDSKRIMLIHNILWSHYKAKVFTELSGLMQASGKTFFVVQVADSLIEQTALNTPDLSIHNYPYVKLFEGLYGETSLRQRYGALKREVKCFNPDVCILPGWADPVFYLLTIYLRAIGVKIIQTVDSIEANHHNNPIKEFAKSLLLKPVSLVFTYGTLGRRYLRKLGVPDEKIYRRIQATDGDAILKKADWGNTKDDPPSILFVGRIVKAKGIGELIDAFVQLDTHWELVIVGDGPDRVHFESLVAENPRVRFEGAKNWDEVGNYYKQASLFVLPSHGDIWGLVVNEAMLFGLPVIVTDNCGCHADLVRNGENGYVIPTNDIAALKQTISLFTTGRKNASKFGLKSLEIIKSFTPERAAQQMMGGIQAVINDG